MVRFRIWGPGTVRTRDLGVKVQGRRFGVQDLRFGAQVLAVRVSKVVYVSQICEKKATSRRWNYENWPRCRV